MDSKLRQLLISLVLGIGLILNLFTLFSILNWKESVLELPIARAAGPRYVAPIPTGTDIGNDCLNNATPCATIQHAVDLADPGDEIRVAAGTYTDVFTHVSVLFSPSVITQTVYVSKSIIIRGGYTTTNWNISNPLSNLTVFDAQGMGRVIAIEAPALDRPISVTIEGLRITNGDATGQVGCGGGGGIYGCAVTATLLNNYVFNNSSSGSGGGVVLFGSSQGGLLTLVGNRITTNTVTSAGGPSDSYGGGVALGIPGTNGATTLDNNTIRNNSAIGNGSSKVAAGGGLYIDVYSVSLNNNIIQTNEAKGINDAMGYGGGLSFEKGNVSMTNNVVSDNWISGPGSGAGLIFKPLVGTFTDSQAHLLHTTVARNSGGDGSGISVLTSTTFLTNTIIASHTLGISVAAGSTATLNGVLWFNNTTDNITGSGKITLNNETTGDPVFSSDGYHLELSSTAIDKGVSTGLMTDIDGETRDFALPDLGADEAMIGRFLFLPIILHN